MAALLLNFSAKSTKPKVAGCAWGLVGGIVTPFGRWGRKVGRQSSKVQWGAVQCGEVDGASHVGAAAELCSAPSAASQGERAGLLCVACDCSACRCHAPVHLHAPQLAAAAPASNRQKRTCGGLRAAFACTASGARAAARRGAEDRLQPERARQRVRNISVVWWEGRRAAGGLQGRGAITAAASCPPTCCC